MDVLYTNLGRVPEIDAVVYVGLEEDDKKTMAQPRQENVSASNVLMMMASLKSDHLLFMRKMEGKR